MKGTIIFDFDDTLFNTKKLKNDYFELLTVTGITTEELQELYTSFSETAPVKTNQAFEDFISLKGHPVPAIARERFESLDLSSYVKLDTISVLERLKKDFRLILVSKGEETFQLWKMNGSGLNSFFEEILITEGNKEVVLSHKKFLEPVFFINDKSEENNTIRSHFPSWTILHTHEYVTPAIESGILVSSLADAEIKIRGTK